MGDDYFILREDGFLSIDVKVSSIVYHNILNLILIKTVSGVVHVLDVNSGVLLLSSDLSSDQLLGLEYIPGADRILYWDEKGIGARSDYNGVLLLHSALQQPLTDSHEQKSILLELLLSEAVILNQCLPTLDSNSIEGLNDVALALREAIDSANQEAKKGVKAQKWSFVVLNVDQTSLRQVANGAVTELKSQSRRIPALAIASSIAHRANDLVPGSKPKESRILMSSEAARKDTFKGWPHMDYKWALPAQMAQAGFYHQPSTKGEDRAMCFTCMVCLVCWEKSDEPWVEHERHSPNCPFVRGEYTHNVPTSVANATTAALPMPGITVISKGNTGDLIAVGKSDGQLNIFKFDSGLKPYRTVTLSAYDAIFSGKLTTETNKVWSESLEKESYKYGIELTSMAFIGLKPQHNYSQESYGHNNESKDKEELKSKAKPSLICGVIVSRSELSNGEADIKVVEDSIQSTLFHSMPDSSASEMMVKSMNDLNHGNTNSVAGNSLFLLTYAVEPSSMTPATVLQSATNSSSNKSGGSTKVISRPHDTNVYDDIYGNNYSDDDTELPNYTTMDDNWGVIQAASSSKEGGGSSKFYFPKKIMVTKHIKVFPSIQHPIKVSTNMNKSASVDEHNHAAWMQYDSAMQDIVDKLTKDTIFTSLPPIIKMTDQTDAAMLNGDPFTGHLLNSNVGEPMEISTLKFYGDSNEKFKLAGFNLSKQSTQLTNVSSESANLETVAEETISQCVGVQCVCLPNNIILSDKLKITALVPSENGKHLVVVISTNIEDLKNNKKEICDTPMSCVEKSECFGYVLVYNILSNCPFYTLDETPSACIELPFSEMPLDLCMLPSQKNGIQSFASISVDGSLKIYTLPNLKQVNYLKIDGGGFVSVAYCTSVERICVCSDTGLLYFYSFSNSDQSSNVENNEDEGELKKSAPNVTKSMDTSEKDERLLEKSLLEHGDLKTLMELTGLYGGNVGLQYNAVVPGFWCELSPAQRPRDDHQNHRRWRLQTNVSTWDEHMLEITLPMATPLAHIQFSYNLHQPCVSLPIIQVTLLKQNLHGIGMKRQTARQGQEDSNVTFPLLDSTKNSVENPVNSKEYLRAHNAEILAGPVLLSQGLDLSQQRGSLILTSPKLYRAKGRTFLIHIKTLFDPAKDNTNYKINKSPEPNGKKAEFIGCDWLHHISITVRGLPRYEAPERRLNRIGMLESNNFLDNLFSVANNTHDNYEKRMRALDIILWVVSVRLQRFRTARPDKLDFMEDEGAPTKSTVSLSGAELQQHECVSIVERNVNELIVNCVLNAKRSIAKKSIMIILITNEGVKNLSKPWKFSFEATVLNSVVNCIPLLGAAPSAGGMHWLSKLAIQVSPIDAQGLLNEKCLNLLEDVAVVMEKRINMYYCLLRARFGLYGLPLEEEIFEQEAPTLDKSAPPVMPYGTANSSNDTPSHPSTTRVQNDLRDLYYMISEQDAKNRTAWWKEWDSLQFDESLPLIVTCHSASDGTKLESAIPTSNMDHPTQLWVKVNEGKLGSDWQKMGGWDVWEDPEENLMECEGESGDDVSQDAVMQDPLLKLNGACWSMSWGWVLQGGGSHTLLVERMHSGARRFAVLQLPRPVRLTDIIIPACNELVSLSVEVWLTDEEKDCTKIIHHTTIVNTPLLLTDIQPAPICRFIKITTIGRYGMPAMKCRIPLGNFFGEVVDLPTTRVAIESLLSLKEDVTCRYRLAANKLKELLDPFLDNYEGNFGHMTSYLASPGEADPKVLYAYEETIDLQRQLYRIKCVLSKVQGEPSKIVYKPDDVEDHRELLEKSCTDKLRAIVDNVLHMLLYFNYELEEKQTNRGSMTEEQCERVLGLLACSSSNTAASLALLLVKLCGSTSYWPRILPKSLLDMAVSPVPKPIDRYLILVILMARRTLIASSSVESGVTEAIATSVFSATGPARLLILTLLASCLDAAPLPRPSWKRWDFVTGGRAVSQNKDDIANGAFAKGVNPDIRIHRRKLHKKLLHYKHNLPQDIDSARRAALHVQRLSLINKIRTGSESNVERPPQLLTQDTAAALVRHLLQLVNDADQDSLILIAKVVGRVVSSRGGGSISSEALKPLCKRAVSTSSWPAHALTTLLQDFVEYEYCAPGEQEMSQTARYSQEDDPSLLRPRPLKMIVASRSPAPCISPVTCDMPFVDYEESDFEDRAIDNHYVECMGKALAAKQPTAQNMPPSNNLLACIPSVWCYGIEWRAGIWSERARCEGSGSLRTALSSPLVRARLPSPPRARRQRHLDVHRQLHEAFSELFSDMQLQHDSTYMENVLSLWMTLNATAKPETHIQWVPVTENMEAPRIRLTVISVRHLLQSLVQQENISLRCWIMALHTLAWICQSPTQTTTGNTSGTEETMAEATLQSPNFVLALIKFMSTQFTNDGIVLSSHLTSEWGAMLGPTACAALSYVLRRVCGGHANGAAACARALGASLRVKSAVDVRVAAARHLLHSVTNLTPAHRNDVLMLIDVTALAIAEWMCSSESSNIETSTLSVSENPFSEPTLGGLLADVLVGSDRTARKTVDRKQLMATTLHCCRSMLSLPLECDSEEEVCETDESKASQKADTDDDKRTKKPKIADAVLQNRGTMYRLLKALTYSDASNYILTKRPDVETQLTMDTLSISDELYLFMTTLAELASNPELIVTPLLNFMSDYKTSNPREKSLSNGFVRLVEVSISECGALGPWCANGGLAASVERAVSSLESPATLAAALLDHLKLPPRLLPLPPKRSPPSPADLVHQDLINYAPLCSVMCSNPTAQAGDVLVGCNSTSGTGSVRRARAAAWTYHFYGGDEPALTLALAPPHAFKLHEIHLQPHLTGLATCPSAVGVEISCGCNNVPLGAPQPTSGLTFIRLALSKPTVVTALQIKLYKPRDSSNMGLLNIRVLGTPAFAFSPRIDKPLLSEEWMRVVSRCVGYMSESGVSSCEEELRSAAAACVEALIDRSPSARAALTRLATARPDMVTHIFALLLSPKPHDYDGAEEDEKCSLTYWLCTNGSEAEVCLRILMSWVLNSNCASPQQFQCLASSLWWHREHNRNSSQLIEYDECLAIWQKTLDIPSEDVIQKKTLDAVLCSMCYIKPEFYKRLLQEVETKLMGDHVENESVTDDRKAMTILPLCDWSAVTNEQLNTMAMCAQSPSAVTILLSSRLLPAAVQTLTQFGNQIIPEITNETEGDIQMGEYSKFGSNIVQYVNVEDAHRVVSWLCCASECDCVSEWLGRSGHAFWKPLLLALSLSEPHHRNWDEDKIYRELEEKTIRLFSTMTTMNSYNQKLFATTLHDILKAYSQYNPDSVSGVSGFTRALIVRLLLRCERARVALSVPGPIATHPKIYSKTVLRVHTRMTIAELLNKRNCLKHSACCTSVRKDTATSEGSSSANKAPSNAEWEMSVAAASCAKDKRTKDVSNARIKRKRSPHRQQSSSDSEKETFAYVDGIDGALPLEVTIGDLCAVVRPEYGANLIVDFLDKECTDASAKFADITCSAESRIETPVLLRALGPELVLLPAARAPPHTTPPPPPLRSHTSDAEWVKLDELFHDVSTTSAQPSSEECVVPAHSLFALGLLLKLPGYAEAFLQEGTKAVNLLRLLLAVTDDEDGRTINGAGLGTLPLKVLARLLQEAPPHEEKGRALRKSLLREALVPLLFTCLAVFTHHAPDSVTPNEISQASNSSSQSKNDEKKQYWAKGTGFGTGSTQQSWNVEQALLRQKTEEEHVTVLLQVISSYIYPNEEWNPESPSQPVLQVEPPNEFINMLCSSALVTAICSYLRNDSVLDMSRHIGLYVVVVRAARALWALRATPKVARSLRPIPALIAQMARTTSAYANTLRANKKLVESAKNSTPQPNVPTNKKQTNSGNSEVSVSVESTDEDEGLAALILDIQATAKLMRTEEEKGEWNIERPLEIVSREARYIEIMRKLQFDSFEMIEECSENGGFRMTVSHAFEAAARAAGTRASPQRMKRLAQEAATLASSLPLSHSSSVFVRTDTARLDIMKVLITGPSDTPYANGCFVLDVYFPPDYPNVPMMVNLETTGRHTVRFNPNLYNDGKVCLSVLNTWHGRPEEKWNAHTSSFLQVLVSIQSLILVPEPYFNEPGYERSRGTRAGAHASVEYNSNIYQACVRWAMLELLREPTPCFKEVIQTHFWIKRNDICKTVAGWIEELDNHTSDKRTQRSIAVNLASLKRHYVKLCEELGKLQAPPGLEDLDEEFNPVPASGAPNLMVLSPPTTSIQPTDTDMEKIVSEVID